MTDEDKWTFLREVPHRDAGDERIQQLARYLLAAAGGNERRFAMLAMTVAKDWIHQTSDVNRTGGEDIAGLTREPHPDDAVEALRRGSSLRCASRVASPPRCNRFGILAACRRSHPKVARSLTCSRVCICAGVGGL